MFINNKKPENEFADYNATEPFASGSTQLPGRNNAGFVSGVTEPVRENGRIGSVSQTQPVTSEEFGNNMDHNTTGTDGVSENPFVDYQPTTPISPFSEGLPGEMPVVGWLVCIEGAERGRDYRLTAGYNSIGRNPENNVYIPADDKISRDKHAFIGFDEQDCFFFFTPFNGKNLNRLNGQRIMNSVELKAYDVLTIGSSKFCFIPFCSEQFSWENK